MFICSGPLKGSINILTPFIYRSDLPLAVVTGNPPIRRNRTIGRKNVRFSFLHRTLRAGHATWIAAHSNALFRHFRVRRRLYETLCEANQAPDLDDFADVAGGLSHSKRFPHIATSVQFTPHRVSTSQIAKWDLTFTRAESTEFNHLWINARKRYLSNNPGAADITLSPHELTVRLICRMRAQFPRPVRRSGSRQTRGCRAVATAQR